MKKNLLFCMLVMLCFSVQICTAQIKADSVFSSFSVLNPQNAVDNDSTNYAVMTTAIGIENSADLVLGFPQEGVGGMSVSLVLEADNGLLNASILGCLDITLINTKGDVVIERTGADLANANIINGAVPLSVTLKTGKKISDIAAIHIHMTGSVNVLNSIRIYKADLFTVCPNFFADILHSSQNIQNASNAVNNQTYTQYALLTPPLLLGGSNIDLGFSQPGDAGKTVYYGLGLGNTLLTASLLQDITVTVYDTKGNVVYTKAGFALADVESFEDSHFILPVETPSGSYSIGSAKISLGSLLNVASTLKVYHIAYAQNNRPPKAVIKAFKGKWSVCKGDSLQLSINDPNADDGTTFQWYFNGREINGETANLFYAHNAGQYSVLASEAGGCTSLSNAVAVSDGTCLETPLSIMVNAFPNPCTNYSTLNINSEIKTNTQIIVSDKSGLTIETHELSSGQGTVRILDRATTGIYYIKIISGTSVQTTKVMKL